MTKLEQIELTYWKTLEDHRAGQIETWEAILTIAALIETVENL